jgi:hypothetical protein
MSKTRFTRRAARLAVVSAAGALLVSGIAWAAIPDGGGAIHGCYQKIDGQLRVIDPGTGASCNPSEQALDWNQTGPAGAPGPQGPQGPAGPGVAYHYESATTTVPAIAHDYGLEIECSPDEGKAISGGATIDPLDVGVLEASVPVQAPSPGFGWRVRYVQNGSDPNWAGATITAWVVCAG